MKSGEEICLKGLKNKREHENGYGNIKINILNNYLFEISFNNCYFNDDASQRLLKQRAKIMMSNQMEDIKLSSFG